MPAAASTHVGVDSGEARRARRALVGDGRGQPRDMVSWRRRRRHWWGRNPRRADVVDAADGSTSLGGMGCVVLAPHVSRIKAGGCRQSMQSVGTEQYEERASRSHS